MSGRLRLLAPPVLCALAALISARPALASSPAAHTTAEPAKVAPYPVTAEPAKVTPYRVTAPRRPANARSLSAVAGPRPCTGPGSVSAAQASYGFGYLANEIAQAYQLTPFYQQGDAGQGQTIALLELEPNSASDIAAYQACYGTSTTVNYIPVDGGINGDGHTDTTHPGSGEAALDIEQVIGLAPNATIDVYQAPNTTGGILDAYQAMVDNPAVTVISTSWGACEAGNPLTQLESAIFATAAQRGISTFAAAGDSGSTDCGTSALAVDDPASQPGVTGVGGTTMPNIAAVDQQFAWNGSGIGAGVTGGGFSSVWTEPPWQHAAAAAAQTSAAAANELTCPAASSGGYCRAVPDVSADSDPHTGYIIYLTENVTNPQTGTTSPQLTATPWGGTSAAAPLWAAITALSNASSACNGHDLGPLNPLLYQLAVKGMPGLTNITAGNNDDSAYNPAAFFTAGRGYSPVAGLGTPLAAALARSLCAQADTLTLNAPASETSTAGQPVDLTAIGAVDLQGHALTYSASQLPAGLSIDAGSGAITGTPTAATSATVRVTVTAADNGATRTAVIPWTVTAAPINTANPPGEATTSATPATPAAGQSSGGGKPTSPSIRVIHVVRRYHGRTIYITVTITVRDGRDHVLVTYSNRAGRSKLPLPTIQLVLSPLARTARNSARHPHPIVLATGHSKAGKLSVTLRQVSVSRPVTIRLRYSAQRQDFIALPRL